MEFELEMITHAKLKCIAWQSGKQNSVSDQKYEPRWNEGLFIFQSVIIN